LTTSLQASSKMLRQGLSEYLCIIQTAPCFLEDLFDLTWINPFPFCLLPFFKREIEGLLHAIAAKTVRQIPAMIAIQLTG
jgi:hypothetical protein